MKYLILGNGWIGNKIHDYLEDSVVSDIRIRRAEDVVQEVIKHNAHYVISCIGKTGMANIDWCENNKEETLYMNTIVPGMIQKACSFTNARMVHLGTGCIYTGDKLYTEEDVPNFIESYYAKTKYLGEQILKDFNVLQLRIKMPIDSTPHRRNFLTKILSYNRLISEKNSFTIIPTFLSAMKKLMDMKCVGIFNMVDANPITHKQIIDIYNQYTSIKKNVEWISVEDLEKITIAKRANCTLSTNKIEKLGIINHSNDLNECIRAYANSEVLCVV